MKLTRIGEAYVTEESGKDDFLESLVLVRFFLYDPHGEKACELNVPTLERNIMVLSELQQILGEV